MNKAELIEKMAKEAKITKAKENSPRTGSAGDKSTAGFLIWAVSAANEIAAIESIKNIANRTAKRFMLLVAPIAK